MLLRSCHWTQDGPWSHLSCIDVSEDSRQLAPAPGPDSQAGPELTPTLGAGVLTPRAGAGEREGGGVRGVRHWQALAGHLPLTAMCALWSGHKIKNF